MIPSMKLAWSRTAGAAALALLMVAGPVAAQWENRIGISASPDYFGDRLVWGVLTPFNAYFVLSSPRTEDGDTVTACAGFELRVTIFGTPGALFRLTEALPPGWLNALDASNPWDASYQVTSPLPVPVTGDHVVLMTWQMMALGGIHEVWLQPLDAPTVPGRLAYWRPDEAGAAAAGAQASNDYFPSPELFVNVIFDRVENQSFGQVKALYR